jgi:hypothetical protein
MLPSLRDLQGLSERQERGPGFPEVLPVLRSVIQAPTDGGPVRALHASFHDFVVDSNRCVGIPLNHIDATLYHLKFAKICLKKLCTLKRDLLGLGELEGFTLTEITNADVIDQITSIPKDLCYAVKYWSMHFACAHSILDEELLLLLGNFIESHIIHWVEALSYLGYLSPGIEHLKDVINTLNVSNSSIMCGTLEQAGGAASCTRIYPSFGSTGCIEHRYIRKLVRSVCDSQKGSIRYPATGLGTL